MPYDFQKAQTIVTHSHQEKCWARGAAEKLFLLNREIRKVRKTQDQNPEFGPKPGEIQKKPCEKAH
jgi:hypothetical protein